MGRLLTLLAVFLALGVPRRAGAALAAQRGHLFAWVPVCLAAGIGIYFALPVEPAVSWLAVSAGLGAALLLCSRRLPAEGGPLAIGTGLLLLGLALAGTRAHQVAAPQLGFQYYGPIEGRVIALDRSASDVPRLTLDQVVLSRVAPDKTPVRLRVSLHGPPDLQGRALDVRPGQRVALTGHLVPPGGPVEPGGFDFRRHAWFERIGAVGYSRTPVVLNTRAAGSQRLLRLRLALSRHLQAQLPGEIGGFAAALMTGDRSGMGQETLEVLRRSNLAHLLAISGLHMGLLTGFVFAALRMALLLAPRSRHHWPGKKIAALGALVAAMGYLALSGGNVATQRAFIMVAVMLGAVLADLRALSLRAVALAALLVLLLRPEALLGPGFQMSFAATTALVCVFGRLEAQLPGPRWIRPALALLLSSTVASAATAPFSMAHFNLISRYGLLANLLAVPAMGLVAVPMAVLAALLMPLGLDGVALQGMALALRWILRVAQVASSWGGAVGQVVAPAPAVLPLMTAGGVLLLLWQGRGRWGGLVPLALGVGLWLQTERPALLISESGGLVGVMTSEGRALSRDVGEGFVAKIWLENDGQPADQAASAELWPGAPGRLRFARVEGVEVLHVSGRRAAGTVSGCGGAGILVANVPVAAVQGCEIFDPERLRATGAVAFRRGPGGLEMEISRRHPPRLWQSGGAGSQ
ncbi:ComEC family competence protein [Salipiger pacificus]|nr:ComEC family competence protein [Alloyangia pacifica]